MAIGARGISVALEGDLGAFDDLAADAAAAGLDALVLEEVDGGLDPIVAAAFLATRHDLLVGVATPLRIGRAPSVLAKLVAGLDAVAGGKAFVVIGADGPLGPGVVEAATLVETMLSQDETTFAGETFRVDSAWNTPRPASRVTGFPKVSIGTDAARVADAAGVGPALTIRAGDRDDLDALCAARGGRDCVVAAPRSDVARRAEEGELDVAALCYRHGGARDGLVEAVVARGA